MRSGLRIHTRTPSLGVSVGDDDDAGGESRKLLTRILVVVYNGVECPGYYSVLITRVVN